MNPRSIPYPPEQSGLSSVVRYRGNPLLRFEDARDNFGDVVGFQVRGQHFVILHDPEAIEDVLVHKHAAFNKDTFTAQLREVLGLGLLTSEGAHWKRQRKLIAPPLQPRELKGYIATMAERAEALAGRFSDGEVRDVHADLMPLTLDILVRTLFGATFSDFSVVEREIDAIMRAFRPLTEMVRSATPAWLPLPSRYLIRRARRELDRIVYRIIQDKHRALGADLLSQLIAATDESGGMTDENLRDEAMTLFLAGHETTALALTYTLRLLALHPKALTRVERELDDVLHGQRPEQPDLERLPYTRAVIEETLRLYPPAWVMAREPKEDAIVGNVLVPKGTQIIIPLYSVQRDPRWFVDPERFLPERFLARDGAEPRRIPRFSSFAFGGGPRVCIGRHFAMAEAVVVLACLLQKARFEALPGEPFGLAPAITLRPRYPVRLRVRRRLYPGKSEPTRRSREP